MALSILITGKNRRCRAMAAFASAACGLVISAPQARAAGADSALSPAAPPAELSLTIPAVAIPAEPAVAYPGRTEVDRLRALDCLAQAIYYEAGAESEDGQRAVAQVVLNRVRHPAWPDSICGVVYQGPLRARGGCQFTFTCDGSLAVAPSGTRWDRARRLAAEAIAGRVHARVGGATHYHARYVAPAWAPRLRRTTVIGAHHFYRLPGPRGDAAAFTDRYTGIEPMPASDFTIVRRWSAAAGLADQTGAIRAVTTAQPAAAPITGR